MSASTSNVEAYDKVIVVIPREEVTGSVEARTATFLSSLTETPESICEYYNQIIISFEGYDADHREVWLIPEVCAYVDRISAAFSEWGFFLSTHSIPTIARCLLGADVHEKLPTVYVNKLLEQVVERMFVSIGAMGSRAGFSDEQLQRRFSEVAHVVLGVDLSK